jgi:DNA-binding transcriptional MerR regulator
MGKRTQPEPTLYSISQVTALTAVPTSTIRFWEKEFGESLVPLRSAGNQRRYDDRAVAVIKRINQLVNGEGYTLEGTRRKLRTQTKGKEAGEAAAPHLNELAETMSDVLLRKLFAQIKA